MRKVLKKLLRDVQLKALQTEILRQLQRKSMRKVALK